MSDPSTDTIKKLGTTGILRSIIGPELTESLFEKMTARKYFEMSSPKTQCVQGGAGIVIPYKAGVKGMHKGSLQTCTKCYICGLPILELGKKQTGMFPECEHVLPIIAAAIYLKLYSQKDKGKPSYQLQLEYKWAHHICNQEKLDYWPLYIEHVKSSNAMMGGGKSSLYHIKSPSQLKSLKSPRKKSTIKNFTMKKSMGSAARGRTVSIKKLPEVEYIDGAYNLQKILTEEIPPIHSPRGTKLGDLMRVHKGGIDKLLGEIWDTTRQRSHFFKMQLKKIYGTKEMFIRCRRNHIINIYQEIADHINSITYGGHSLANLITLAGLSGLEPKMYRPDQEKQLESMKRNPEKVQEEAALLAAETLAGIRTEAVEPSPSPSRPLSRSGSLTSVANSIYNRHAPTLAGLRNQNIGSISLADTYLSPIEEDGDPMPEESK